MPLETSPEHSPSALFDPPGAPERRPVQAGPLRLELEPETAILRSVAWGNEVGVHAVYGAVRDAAWNVVPGHVHDWSLEAGVEAFRASFRLVHRTAEVHFEWRGSIEGSCDGVVRYDFSGEALSSFWRCRIGLCVLWPLRTGRTRWVWRQDRNGDWTHACLPHWIDPAMDADSGWSGLRALAWPVGQDRWLESAWDGELFELEDQRNWTDASFKAYGTPLAEPSPVFLSAGTVVRQRATLRLRCSAAFPTAPGERVRGPLELAERAEVDRVADAREALRLRLLQSETIRPLRDRRAPLGVGRTLFSTTTIRVLGLPEPESRFPSPSDLDRVRVEVVLGSMWPLPKLGVELGQPLELLESETLTRLRGLDLAHVRWHLNLTRPDWPERFAAAAAKVKELGVGLELFLTWPARACPDGLLLRRAVESSGVLLSRIGVWTDGAAVTSAQALAGATAALGGLGVPVGAGSSAHFYDLNQVISGPGKSLAQADFLCWPMQPQVHASDPATIMENAAVQGQTVEAAQRRGYSSICLGPIGLGPGSAEGEREALVAARLQRSLGGAAWTVASLAGLATSLVESVTYFATHGDQGLLAMESFSSSAEGATAPNSVAVHPAYHVLAACAGFTRALRMKVDRADVVAAVALTRPTDGASGVGGRKSEWVRVLVANPTDRWVRVTLRGLQGPVRCREIGPATVLAACQRPADFWAGCQARMMDVGEGGEWTLGPYALVVVDGGTG